MAWTQESALFQFLFFIVLLLLLVLPKSYHVDDTKVRFRPYEEEIRQYLFTVDPSALHKVDGWLDKYRNRESELLRKVKAKYTANSGIGNGKKAGEEEGGSGGSGSTTHATTTSTTTSINHPSATIVPSATNIRRPTSGLFSLREQHERDSSYPHVVYPTSREEEEELSQQQEQHHQPPPLRSMIMENSYGRSSANDSIPPSSYLDNNNRVLYQQRSFPDPSGNLPLRPSLSSIQPIQMNLHSQGSTSGSSSQTQGNSWQASSVNAYPSQQGPFSDLGVGSYDYRRRLGSQPQQPAGLSLLQKRTNGPAGQQQHQQQQHQSNSRW
eukprot:gene1735-1895_t